MAPLPPYEHSAIPRAASERAHIHPRFSHLAMSGGTWPSMFSGTFRGSGSSELESVKAKVEKLKRYAPARSAAPYPPPQEFNTEIVLTSSKLTNSTRSEKLKLADELSGSNARLKEMTQLLQDAEAKQEELRAEADSARRCVPRLLASSIPHFPF